MLPSRGEKPSNADTNCKGQFRGNNSKKQADEYDKGNIEALSTLPCFEIAFFNHFHRQSTSDDCIDLQFRTVEPDSVVL
jgi:hypothetical protein